ncbi:hypothetical protein FACS189425_09540 [Clostridia bacterium]|nr:hypothetical protein FACS189425_09540 [Clostridia bacterium]
MDNYSTIDLARWAAAIRARRSVRDLTAPPDKEQLTRLAFLCKVLEGDGVRIELLEAVKSPCVTAALIAGKDTRDDRLGFKGEALVLEATAMGLGSCWRGGGAEAKHAKKTVKLGEGERVAIVITIGQPKEPPADIPDEARKRRPLEKLVVTSGGSSLADMEPWQNAALKAARVAPSAINTQPWRFAFVKGAICMVRVGLFAPTADLDLGIAMLHVELAAAAAGFSGAWSKTKDPNSKKSGEVWIFTKL